MTARSLPHIAQDFWQDESGASLVEFSLVVTLFLFFLFGMVDFGRIGHAWVGANKATQLAARLAAVRPPVCPNVPRLNARGSGATPAFGALCRAASGVCFDPGTFTCTSTTPGLTAGGLATAQEIFTAVRPLVPPGTTIGQMQYSYSPDPNLGFLGGPYVPMVTVEFINVCISDLPGLSHFIGALLPCGPNQRPGLRLPGMSVSLPGEDLGLGTDG